MRRGCLAVVLVVAVAIVVWLVFKRSPTTPQVTLTNAAAGLEPTNALPPSTSETNSAPVKMPAELLSEVNRFIAVARPFGVDQPIKSEDIIGSTNYPKNQVVFETKTHTLEFFGKRLHHFLANLDMSNPVGDDDALRNGMKTLYQATAKWTEQEALAETLRILQQLGIEATWEKQEAKPFPITVKNPQGEKVDVIPFYKVTLEGPQGTVMAEFRMGQSGPGRLTEWFNHTRPVQ
jgi:hypothetical protein